MSALVLKANEAEEYYFDEGCYILELSNTSIDPEVSIARARVKPGVTTKLHRLKGVVERYVIISGNGLFDVPGAPTQNLAPGDVVIIPPMSPQSITNNCPEDLIFLAICSPRFTVDIYENLA